MYNLYEILLHRLYLFAVVYLMKDHDRVSNINEESILSIEPVPCSTF